MTFDRWVSIHTGLPHYLDHLGVLSIELGLPFIATEEATYQCAKKYYPELQIELMEPRDLNLNYLATHFDVIFESGHFWAAELLPQLELFFQKKMRMVYCPHGNSDKGHSHQNHPKKDISLVYGPHMQDHLIRTKSPVEQTVMTGNYRFRHYRERKNFYDQLLQPFLRSLDPAKKTVLYAPSWPDPENPSSFADICFRVIEELGEYYNVMVRWHPFLDDLYPALVEQLFQKYHALPGVALLQDFPCIYPILNAADAYLGDFSSIGYDYLAFDRPLYFLGSHAGFLYQYGTQLAHNQHFGKQIITRKKETQKAYSYVFGEERTKDEILNDLQEALSLERASWK